MPKKKKTDESNNGGSRSKSGSAPNGVQRRARLFEHWKVLAVLLILYDIVAIHAAYFLGLWLRFDFVFSSIPEKYLRAYALFISGYAVVSVVVFMFFKLYRSMWRFASYAELVRTFLASVMMSAVHAVLITVIFGRMPFSYYLTGTVLQFLFLIAARFFYRFVLYLRSQRKRNMGSGRVMLIGAGAAGQMILRELSDNNEISDKVVCIIDDNPNKWGRYIDRVPIVGGREDILANVDKYCVNKIYIAIPSATAAEKRDILSICNETSCELKQLPGVYQLVTGQISVSKMKDVSVEDLLGREPIRADMSEVYDFINDKVVMITGGGGSIGSELARQVAAHSPKQLIILDIYENNAYDIQIELREKYPSLDLKVVIASVRDSRRMFGVFEEFHPDIVYHAAAHKHVPLMEDSPCEAIKNNVFGTYKTAYAAMVHGCRRFVLISTDKAVNPTNIMGASKRLCEMVIQSFDRMIKTGRAAEIPQLFTHAGCENAGKDCAGDVLGSVGTEFVAVRFGNVLGSNGSVIPIFRKQIAKGGPVTVTHPDIIRYFMTIPEAVSLVMLAGTYAKGGEIFVLDMGSPMKIDTLARNLIKQSGFKPDVDVKIEYTGLRPGEKLYEEKLMAEEGLQKTPNELIHIGKPVDFDTDEFLGSLEGLMKSAYANRRDIKETVKQLVRTYREK